MTIAPHAADRRLRILAVTSDFPALSETFVLDQVIGLMDLGHEVAILADGPRHGEAAHAEFLQRRLDDHTRYLAHATSRWGNLRSLLHLLRRHPPIRSGYILAALAGAFVRARRPAGEQGDWARLLALLRALSEQPQPDIVICHFGTKGAEMARAAEALGWRAPIVTLFYGFDLSLMVKLRGPHLYEHLFHTGRLFLPITEAFTRILASLGCPAERIRLQRLGVDMRRMDRDVAALPPRAGRGGPFTFITVARLVEKKGHTVTIRAFARAFAHRDGDVARLVLVGDGPLHEGLVALVASLGMTDRVSFLGGLPRAEVLQHMMQAGALVQASVTASNGDTEGLPVVITEAMALGLPVIATRHSSIPEVVTDGVTGLLVDEHDEEALAAAMIAMIERPDAARELARAARTFIETEFDAAKWLLVLNERLLECAAAG